MSAFFLINCFSAARSVLSTASQTVLLDPAPIVFQGVIISSKQTATSSFVEIGYSHVVDGSKSPVNYLGILMHKMDRACASSSYSK